MKKRLQGLIVGIIIGALAVGGTVFAKQAGEMAEIFYNNIKIFIDGGEIVPKDANGNVVEPFIYNGTTYLPVRAVSSALGMDVLWDGENQSVYIGKEDNTKPDNYLHKIQYNDYKEASGSSWMNVISGTVTDYNGNVYTNGLLFYSRPNSIENDSDKPSVVVAYPLNSQYKNLKGKMIIPKSYDTVTGKTYDASASPCNIWIYGDDKLLYKAVNVNASMPFEIDVNVKGINQLVIKLKSENHSDIALTDLALYK